MARKGRLFTDILFTLGLVAMILASSLVVQNFSTENSILPWLGSGQSSLQKGDLKKGLPLFRFSERTMLQTH